MFVFSSSKMFAILLQLGFRKPDVINGFYSSMISWKLKDTHKKESNFKWMHSPCSIGIEIERSKISCQQCGYVKAYVWTDKT